MKREYKNVSDVVTWDEDHTLKAYPTLKEDTQADVVVIGGGISGVLSAYLLAKEGKKVVLLEKDRIGFGATGVTTAFITESLDTRPSELVKGLGTIPASIILNSHEEAILLIESIIRDEKIDCDFTRCENRMYATTAKERNLLKEELRVLKTLGREASFVGKEENELGFKNEGYLLLEGQAKFHPLKFIGALLERAKKLGVEIYENTEALAILHTSHGKVHSVKTASGNIRADWVLASTYEPFKHPSSLYFKKALYTSYVFELEIERGALSEGIYEDVKSPYHYWRVDAGEKFDRMIVGGEDHRADIHINEEKCFKALEDFVATTFPKLSYKIVRRWSGPILESIDGLAYIGELHPGERVMYAFGFSGNGMTYGAITAQIVVDKVFGRHNVWASLYDVGRSPGFIMLFEKGIDYSKEFFGGAVKNAFKYSSSVDIGHKK
ncbi:MAG: FAD-binding oxidoreductase [Candidatus Pacebacteria bacterium]|nr:FAD-binding oxidoreductase [Candidatus Paceibacterota bacterium]MDD5357058.1 FAD-binding oxidoreductase [Candidatus Paceibacterota bacterium]